MNISRSGRQFGIGITAFALCALLLTTTALGKTKTPFTNTEVMTGMLEPGTWITDGTTLFVTGCKLSSIENASDPRLSGTGTVWMNQIMDLTTGARVLWGRFRLENAGGAWDGYWSTDTTGAGVATIAGSGGYAGLVARWTYLGNGDWVGYVVENGPGEVPMKLRGSREEKFEWIEGAVLDPATMQPTGQFAVIGKVTLVNGGGVGTHVGKITDQTEVGLVTFPTPTTAAWSLTGIMKAANGDLLNWVAAGEKDVQTGVVDGTVHFVGGTGRFEVATGSFAVSSGTGTIRY